MSRKVTIGDVLERSVKRKGEELGSAALLSSVVMITLGSSEATAHIFQDLEPHLIPALTDPSVAPSVRSKCAVTLGYVSRVVSNLKIVF